MGSSFSKPSNIHVDQEDPSIEWKTVTLGTHDRIVGRFAITHSYVFRGRLDAGKMIDAFEKLIHRWPVLGGRLRLTKAGLVQIHIPSAFSTGVPAFNSVVRSFDEPIAEHLHVPRATQGISVQQPLQPTVDYFHPPESFFQRVVLYEHRPMVDLYICTFADATTVGLTLPHGVHDGSGAKTIFDAWTAIIEGRDGDVPDLLPLSESGLDDVEDLEGLHPTKAFFEDQTKPAGREVVYSKLDLLRFLSYLFFDTVMEGPRVPRCVFFPTAEVEKMKKEVNGELALFSAGKKWASSNDIITAWIVKTTCSATPHSNRLFASSMVMDLRSRLPALRSALAGQEKARRPQYMHNAFASVLNGLWKIRTVAVMPLAQIAARIRESFDLLNDDGSTEREVRWRNGVVQSGRFLFSAPPHALSMKTSSWLAFDVFGVDMSGAAMEKGGGVGGEKESTAVGRPTFVACIAHTRRKPSFMVMMIGRDSRGIWTQPSISTSRWKAESWKKFAV